MSVSNEEKTIKSESFFSTGEIKIPMVYIKKTDSYGERYLGLIPSFVMKYVSSNNIDECKILLKNYLMERLKHMVSNNVDIPKFMDEEEIKKEYDDVFLIEYIKLKK